MPPEAQTVLHASCRQTDWNAPTIVGGAGARLLTADGRSILDMSSLAECCNFGHQHPGVVAAVRAQAARLCFVTNAWGAEPRARVAELLLELKTAGISNFYFHDLRHNDGVNARGTGRVVARIADTACTPAQ